MSNKTLEEFLYKLKGIDAKTKKKYVALFNSAENKERATVVIEDLIMRFKYYGGSQSNDPIVIAKHDAHREVLEYIMTMSARISDDTLADIQKFINK